MVEADGSLEGRNQRGRPAQRRHREIDILIPDEVRALMNACSRRAPTGIRNRALIALLYGAGLRIGEALALRPKDLDLDRLTVTIQAGKGNKRGVSALLPDSIDSIQRWVDRRVEFGVTSRDPFFCSIARGASGPHPTAPGGTLSREYVARVLKRMARRIGLSKRIHCHGLRHSHADLLRRRGFDMEQIRRQLRHATLEITGRYLDHLGANDLPEKMRTIGAVLAAPKAVRAELGDILSRLGDREVAQLVGILKRAIP